jgi:hypothetical protein
MLKASTNLDRLARSRIAHANEDVNIKLEEKQWGIRQSPSRAQNLFPDFHSSCLPVPEKFLQPIPVSNNPGNPASAPVGTKSTACQSIDSTEPTNAQYLMVLICEFPYLKRQHSAIYPFKGVIAKENGHFVPEEAPVFLTEQILNFAHAGKRVASRRF